MNPMKTISLFFLCLLMTVCLFPDRRVELPNLEKPDSITADGDRIYITDRGGILIYSLKDLRFVRKFGRLGEGPKEFRIAARANLGLQLYVGPDYLMVNSIGKLSYFKRNGDFIREMQSRSVQTFKPLGDKYVGYEQETVDDILYLGIRLYGADFEVEKEIYRKEWYAQLKKNFNPMHLAIGMGRRALYYTQGNRLYVEGENGEICVFDGAGKRLHTITHNYGKVPITRAHKDEVLKRLGKRGPGLYRLAKQRGKYPEFFPPRFFTVANQKVYVLTYEQEDGKSAFYAFDDGGKFMERVMAPFGESDFLNHYPYSIFNGKLYQVVENEETEEWDLMVYDLK